MTDRAGRRVVWEQLRGVLFGLACGSTVVYSSNAIAGDEAYPRTVVGGSEPPSWSAVAADFGVFAIPAAALWGAALTIEPDRTGRPNTPHSANLNANYWSNWTAVAGPALVGLGTLALDAERLGWGPQAAHATVVAMEAGLISSGLNQVLKRTAGRCRPVAYLPERSEGAGICDPSRVPNEIDGSDDAAYLSWPSGHVAGVASVTGALLGLAIKTSYYGNPVTQYWLAGGVGVLVTGLTAWLRVSAGAHSWQDTLGSAALSVPIGLGVSLLHPVGQSPSPLLGLNVVEPRLSMTRIGLQLSGAF